MTRAIVCRAYVDLGSWKFDQHRRCRPVAYPAFTHADRRRAISSERIGIAQERKTLMTYTNFTVETDADGIALVTWDMPDRSMNVFTEEVMDELEKIIDQVVADAGDQGRGHHLRQGQLLRRRGPHACCRRCSASSTRRRRRTRRRRCKTALRRRRPHGLAVAQARDIRQAVGVGDQRHLHGRRVRIVARLPWPRRGGLATRSRWRCPK